MRSPMLGHSSTTQFIACLTDMSISDCLHPALGLSCHSLTSFLLHPITPPSATPTNPGHFQHFEPSFYGPPSASSGILAWPQTIWTNSDNSRLNPDCLPSIADQCTQAPVPIPALWAITSTQWAFRYPPHQ